MKNKIFFIIGLTMVLAGVVMGCFSYPTVELSGFAVLLFGAGMTCKSMWERRKPEAPKAVSIISLICIGLGSFLAGFIGLMKADVFQEIIGYVVSGVMLILGLLLPKITTPKIEKK